MTTATPEPFSPFASAPTGRFDLLTQPTGWPTAIRGALAIVFGIIALASPTSAALALAIVFGVWAFVDGIFAFVVAARRGREGQRWGWFLFEGLVSIAAGIIAFVYPGVTILVLTILVIARAILLGLVTVTAAFTSRETPHRWLYATTGAVSMLFGILLLVELFRSPIVGVLAVVWAIGVYAIIIGAMMLGLGLYVHFRGERHRAPGETWTTRPMTPAHG